MQRSNRTIRYMWRRAAVLTETVFAMPILLAILSLAFYLGQMSVRMQRTSSMVRYETWRTVYEAPGPASNEGLGHPQLNEAFFADQAASLSHEINGPLYPMDGYQQWFTIAEELGQAPGDLAHRMIYLPNDTYRLNPGHREGFKVQHTMPNALWERIDGPIRRTAARIERDWRLSYDPRIGAEQWIGGFAGFPHHLRALRDEYLAEFDEGFDALDGDHAQEYSDYPLARQVVGEELAGWIRSAYLRQPGYTGPDLYHTRPEDY